MSPTKAKTAAGDRAAGRHRAARSRLTDAQLGEVMKLIRGADSVELKVDGARSTSTGRRSRASRSTRSRPSPGRSTSSTRRT